MTYNLDTIDTIPGDIEWCNRCNLPIEHCRENHGLTLIDMPKITQVRHPAKYTDILLPVFARMLRDRRRILDPFGGTGKIFDLKMWLPNAQIEAVEIEPEWAALHPSTTLGNALALPWADSYFDAVCTSPAYGNRMADKLLRDKWKRNTYATELGRELHPDSGAALQWGEAYKDFHTKAWAEAMRVLQPGGVFILNIKDHIRGGRRMHVTEWHCEALTALGFREIEHHRIDCPGNRNGANGNARIAYESVIMFKM